MVNGDLEAEDGGIGFQKPILRREPSFSRWCDEAATDQPLRSTSAEDGDPSIVDDSDFDLPLFQADCSENGSLDTEIVKLGKFQQMSMHMNGGRVAEDSPIHIQRNASAKKYVPFDIKLGSSRKLWFLEPKCEDGNSNSKLKKTPATESCISIATLLRTLFYILLWYTFSTCLTLYNKTLLGDKLGKFPAPFLMNTIHFGMQAVLSKVIIRFWSGKIQPSVTMSWRDYFIRVVPTAIGTALDINLSNISLVFISVTFATMCKSTAPIFLLLFAFAFKLENPSIKLLGIMFIISIGVLLTVAKETQFKLWGFIFVMLAAVMSGFRWCMTQILLQKEAYGLKHPLTFMSYISPVMAMATALLSLMLDPWHKFQRNDYFSNSWHMLRTCLVLLLGGALAFFMVLTEYILVSATSAVTIMIAGVVKEAVTILVAVFYFHDQFTLLKGIGLVIIMVGVSLFNWYKYQKLQQVHLIQNDEELCPPAANGTAKYVILENMDGQDDDS